MQTLTKNIFIRHRLAEIQNPPPGVVAVNKAPQVEIEGEDRIEKKKMKEDPEFPWSVCCML
jgi:hypothetical protein